MWLTTLFNLSVEDCYVHIVTNDGGTFLEVAMSVSHSRSVLWSVDCRDLFTLAELLAQVYSPGPSALQK